MKTIKEIFQDFPAELLTMAAEANPAKFGDLDLDQQQALTRLTEQLSTHKRHISETVQKILFEDNTEHQHAILSELIPDDMVDTLHHQLTNLLQTNWFYPEDAGVFTQLLEAIKNKQSSSEAKKVDKKLEAKYQSILSKLYSETNQAKIARYQAEATMFSLLPKRIMDREQLENLEIVNERLIRLARQTDGKSHYQELLSEFANYENARDQLIKSIFDNLNEEILHLDITQKTFKKLSADYEFLVGFSDPFKRTTMRADAYPDMLSKFSRLVLDLVANIDAARESKEEAENKVKEIIAITQETIKKEAIRIFTDSEFPSSEFRYQLSGHDLMRSDNEHTHDQFAITLNRSQKNAQTSTMSTPLISGNTAKNYITQLNEIRHHFKSNYPNLYEENDTDNEQLKQKIESQTWIFESPFVQALSDLYGTDDTLLLQALIQGDIKQIHKDTSRNLEINGKEYKNQTPEKIIRTLVAELGKTNAIRNIRQYEQGLEYMIGGGVSSGTSITDVVSQEYFLGQPLSVKHNIFSKDDIAFRKISADAITIKRTESVNVKIKLDAKKIDKTKPNEYILERTKDSQWKLYFSNSSGILRELSLFNTDPRLEPLRQLLRQWTAEEKQHKHLEERINSLLSDFHNNWLFKANVKMLGWATDDGYMIERFGTDSALICNAMMTRSTDPETGATLANSAYADLKNMVTTINQIQDRLLMRLQDFKAGSSQYDVVDTALLQIEKFQAGLISFDNLVGQLQAVTNAARQIVRGSLFSQITNIPKDNIVILELTKYFDELRALQKSMDDKVKIYQVKPPTLTDEIKIVPQPLRKPRYSLSSQRKDEPTSSPPPDPQTSPRRRPSSK